MQKSVYTLNTSNTTDTVLMRQSYNTNKEPIALSQNCKLDEVESIHNLFDNNNKIKKKMSIIRNKKFHNSPPLWS